LTTVFQAEYVGDLAPYAYEQERLNAAGIGFSAAVCAGSVELIEQAKDAEFLWLEWSPHVTREVLEALPRCELVIRWGVGYDQIDVQAATELGIAVANAPTYCKQDVVEHTIALALAVYRGIPRWNASLHQGAWRDLSLTERRLSGKTLGVIGVGHIGSEVARLAVAFGCRVLGNDIRPLSSPIAGVSMVDLDELLRESDVICLNVSLQAGSRHLISDRAFELMKDDAVLVNTSRGVVVDQAALLKALDGGKLFGVGLDVFEEEPLPPDNPLRSIDRVVLTPHEAASSPESLAELRKQVCDATIEWATSGWAEAVVNPEVRPRHKSARTRTA
jgi:D-3-phosphoglycerate dehydrogenase / 2-oxoglutarate reductase